MATKKPYNPVALTAEFKQKNQDRGYGYFSQQAVDQQRKDNEGIDVHVFRDAAKEYTDKFMKAVNDPEHPDHMASRTKFYNEYGGSSDAVENARYSQLCDAAGYRPLPQRDTAYENSVLRQKTKNPSAQEAQDHGVFRDLMKSAWDWQGYENDPEVMTDFQRGYVNMRKGSASSVANSSNPIKQTIPSAAGKLKPGSLIANKMAQLQAKYPAEGPLKEIPGK